MQIQTFINTSLAVFKNAILLFINTSVLCAYKYHFNYFFYLNTLFLNRRSKMLSIERQTLMVNG